MWPERSAKPGLNVAGPLKEASYSDGEELMNSDEAGRVNEIKQRGKRAVCAHQRMVDDHYNEQGKKNGAPGLSGMWGGHSRSGESVKSRETNAISPALQRGERNHEIQYGGSPDEKHGIIFERAGRAERSPPL
jgi:hypothetical protein